MPAGYKTVLKSIMVILAALYAGFIIQTSLFSHFSSADITPNIILIVTALYGFFMGEKYGMLTGFAGGLIIDIYSGSWFGMYALIYLYIGLLNGLLSRVYFGDDIKLPLFLVGVSDFLFGIIIYFTIYMPRDRSDPGFYIYNIVVPEMVYTMLIALFLYFPLRRMSEWADQTGERSGRGPRVKGSRDIG